MMINASRLTMASLFLASSMLYLTISQSSASSSEYKTSQSSGLKASIGKIAILTRNGVAQGIAIQLILENVTENRIYVFATGDHRASLSDGNSLRLQEVIGMTYCNMPYEQEKATQLCLNNHGNDLNYYSYIDGGGKVELSLRYLLDLTSQGGSPSGSISFRLIMASRIAHATPNSLEAQADPRNITSPQVVILNFPLTPLNATGE